MYYYYANIHVMSHVMCGTNQSSWCWWALLHVINQADVLKSLHGGDNFIYTLETTPLRPRCGVQKDTCISSLCFYITTSLTTSWLINISNGITALQHMYMYMRACGLPLSLGPGLVSTSPEMTSS